MSPADLCAIKKNNKEQRQKLSEHKKEPWNQISREWEEAQVTAYKAGFDIVHLFYGQKRIKGAHSGQKYIAGLFYGQG